ncbi:hypothetical protein BH09MYX1_BH09MYX1_62490 [soil metagenome]
MAEETHVRLPLDEHPLLDVTADFAHLTLVPIAPGERPYAEVRSKWKNRVRVRGENGTTVVRIGGEDWGLGMWSGKDRVILHVPKDVRARVTTAAGRLFVERLDGCDLEITNDAGTIEMDDVGGALRIVTEAGKIDGQNLRGRFDISSQAGAVRLDITGFEPGEHRVRAEVGAVKIELARGLSVRVDARATMGAVKVDCPNVADADAVLLVETEVGAIKVRSSDQAARTPRAVPHWDHASQGPYRSSAHETSADAAAPKATPASESDEELERILAKVADGSLAPGSAAELLRALRRS